MPASYTTDPTNMGQKQSRLLVVVEALGYPPVRWEKDLKNWLQAQGWLRVIPQIDPRSLGKWAMVKGCYLPAAPTIVFPRKGPLLHTPGNPIPDTTRESCQEYWTQDMLDTPEEYWTRALLEQNERYGWAYNPIGAGRVK